jgi:hypothetical protein
MGLARGLGLERRAELWNAETAALGSREAAGGRTPRSAAKRRGLAPHNRLERRARPKGAREAANRSTIRPVALGLLIASLAGCSTTATIHRSDGYMLEGRIKGGTRSSIIVDPRIGERQEVPRSQVADIDHPGNVHALIGGIVFGIGGISAGANCGQADGAGSDRDADCFYAVSIAITGAAMLGWGLYNWFGSSDAADDVSMEPLSDEKWRGPRRGLPPRKAPPPGELPPESGELPPAPPPPPGAVPPPPSSSAPPAPAPPPSASPPSEPPPGGVVW